MGLKEFLKRDLDKFIREKDFSAEHLINGPPVMINIDSDRLTERIKGDLTGLLVNCDILFFCKVSDLNFEPAPGRKLQYDNSYATIMDVKQNDGEYEIILQFNRGD